MTFESNNLIFKTKLIDGIFPDYEKILHSTYSTTY